MTERITNEAYLQLLKDLQVKKQSALTVMTILTERPELVQTMNNEGISMNDKEGLITKHFPLELQAACKLMLQNGQFPRLYSILAEYIETVYPDLSILHATLYYVTRPSDEDIAQAKKKLQAKYDCEEVILSLKHEPKLVSGFVLQIEDDIYDKSGKAALDELRTKIMRSGFDEDLVNVMRSEVKNFPVVMRASEGGTIRSISDGIVHIDGMHHAMYGEIVVFENGVRGLVQNVEAKSIGCVLLGADDDLKEGSRVVRTKRRAGIGVSDDLLGRVVDALGAPIDGGPEITADKQYPIERVAPGVVERKSVTEPLETGILAIDAMFPIGRGQRELIIGDRQTGKTSIAIDTILNQKGKDVICVYVAVGQKASTISQVVRTLKKHDALPYTVVLAATASDFAPLQYLAPYSGTAIAEYFMDQGKDVLIVYDDLSKHAVAYRAISLLLKRPPGREAYPGDVFYLHSRLLERSCRRNEKSGGGSITALPIIETLAGDVSAYIPTNVISITDGQIFLESDLFFSGHRPAVNVGLSVSRVGGAAQFKAMKQVSGTLRIELAQYKEMESFTQFSSDLDADTKKQLCHGAALMELLKQPLYQPQSLSRQVLTLCISASGQLDTLATNQVRPTIDAFISFMETTFPDIISEISEKHILSQELIEQITKATQLFEKTNAAQT